MASKPNPRTPGTQYRSPSGEIKTYGHPDGTPFNSGGGGGDDGGGGGQQQSAYSNINSEAFLSPQDFLAFAKIQAEGQVAPFAPDVPMLRDLAKGQVTPVYDQFRSVLDTQGKISQAQNAITRGQIAANFDDAYDSLREEYNSRGLFFSGEALTGEGKLLTQKAQSLTLQDLNMQNVLNQIEAKKGQLSLDEIKEIESTFQDLLTSEESVYNKNKSSQINSILANMIPGYVESHGNLKLADKQREEYSQNLRDSLNLQTLDQKSQTFPLELALKVAQVENIPTDQAIAQSNLALKLADVNRIPIEDAMQLAKLQLQQADVENIPLQRQLLEGRIRESQRKLQLGVQSVSNISNLAEGLVLGMVTPKNLYTATNAKNAATIMEAGRQIAEQRLGMSIPYDMWETEMQGVNAGQGSELLNIPAGDDSGNIDDYWNQSVNQ